MESLIKVTQLPVIEERLRSMKGNVDKAVDNAMALVCTEDTIQSIKHTRADLKKAFDELESQRKAVKAAVLDPYNKFEVVYKECVSDQFKRADAALKGKIEAVEMDMKQRCEAGLRSYFEELCESKHIDFVRFEQVGIVVDMTSAKSKRPKKLWDQIARFVDRVEADAALIDSMDDAEEIMVEYKRTLDATGAIATVQERHRRLEAEKEARAARESAKSQDAEAVKRVESFAPPTQEEPVVRCRFTVTATKAQLKRLKEFLNMEGIKYE